MKKALWLSISLIFTYHIALAQVTDVEASLRVVTADSLDGWKKGATLNLGTAQTSLTNWAAGGENSIAVNGIFSGFANLTRGKTNWDNNLDIGYGLLKQGERSFIKTDDKVDLTSKLGYSAFEKWNYALLMNFKTQMSKGFKTGTDTLISNFLAPAYFLAAMGLDYKPNDHFTAFIAPLTGKFTMVNDDALAGIGAFGVSPGEKFRAELGGYIRVAYAKDIHPNISLATKIDLFSNYLKDPQNIDVNWEALLTLKATKYLSASLATNLIWDKDIVQDFDDDGDGATDATEARVQFKEVLSLGLTFSF
ncbi:MAG: DUF3078 domain-containing protein [Bacteroidales bacterium]|nr:DUF3078 domain-containing protein [Bacteroidales bacterium]